jgi:hypothetical protein
MTSRRLAVGVLVLVALVGGGLWFRVYRLHEELARYEATRLMNPAQLSGAPTPGSSALGYAGADSEPPAQPAGQPAAEAAPAIPAQLAAPTLGGQALRLSDESPLEGAIVEVLGAPGPDGQPAILCVTNTVPDGRFVVTAPDLAATALRVWFPVDYPAPEPPPAGHPGYRLGNCIVHTEPLAPGDGRRLDLKLLVDTGWVLWGTVSDTAGHVVGGGVINLVEPHDFSLIDAQGEYRLRDLPPATGPLALMVSGPRVRGTSIDVPPPAAGEHIARFDIQLAPAGMIFGQVQWSRASGKPVMPPIVTVLNPPADALPGSEVTRPAAVDVGGRYQLDGLGPGRWDLSCAWSTVEGQVQRTFTVYSRAIEVEAGAQVQHDFMLPGGATLELTATGADGAPLAGCRVELCHVLDPSDAGAAVVSEVFGVTGPDGRCTLADLAPGTKEVRLLGPVAEPQPGVAPVMPQRVATQRVELPDGTTPLTVVAGAPAAH